MKLMKVRFTEWRDPPVEGRAKTPSELDMVQARIAGLSTRETDLKADFERMLARRKIGDTEELKTRHMAIAEELDNLVATQRAALDTQNSLGEVAAKGMKEHAKAGATGYQVLNDEGTEVLMLLDDAGADLPAGAVYGYEIVDQAPATPPWAAALEASLAAVKP